MTNASATTAKLQSSRGLLSIIAYIKWNSRVTDAARAFLKSGSLDLDIYLAPPLFSGSNSDTK